MEWSGAEWSGAEWSGVEWSGVVGGYLSDASSIVVPPSHHPAARTNQPIQAREYLERGRDGIPYLPMAAVLPVLAIANLFEGIVDALEARDFDSLNAKVKVPTTRKLKLVADAAVATASEQARRWRRDHPRWPLN